MYRKCLVGLWDYDYITMVMVITVVMVLTMTKLLRHRNYRDSSVTGCIRSTK